MQQILLKSTMFFAFCTICIMGFGQNISRNEEQNFQKQILKYINQYRNSKGLANVEMDESLNQIAYHHSMDMSNRTVAFGHDGFNTRMATAKKYFPKMMGFAENVAYGEQSAKEVANDWIESAGHRRNILGNYQMTGIGVERSADGDLYFTQIFAR